jgi:NCS2 family nucleobase:cation symporter-2
LGFHPPPSASQKSGPLSSLPLLKIGRLAPPLRSHCSALDDLANWRTAQLDDELKRQGAIWGARAEVIARASWAIAQVIDAVAENCWLEGPLVIAVSFDEFNLEVDVTYRGEALEFPDRRPTEDEILESEGGVRRLAGYTLRHLADQVRAEQKGADAHLTLRFDH